MNSIRFFTLILLLVVTLFITNTPNFHLEGYLGLHNFLASDIAIHGSYYFVITFPVFLLLQNTKIPAFVIYIFFFIPAIFEFSQALIPGRTVSAYDMLGNYLGLAAGLSICFFMRYLLKGKYRTKT